MLFDEVKNVKKSNYNFSQKTGHYNKKKKKKLKLQKLLFSKQRQKL